MNLRDPWPLMIVAGAGTYLLRLSFLALMDGEKIPDLARRALALVPPAVLAALCLPALVPGHGAGVESADLVRPAAAAFALLAAWRFGNMFLTLGAGMGAFWILKALIK